MIMVEKKTLPFFIAVIAACLVGTMIGYSTVLTQKKIPSSGTVKAVNVGVYWDSACTNVTISIPWGFVEPGTVTTCTVYVKNSGNVPLTLGLAASNWSPAQASTHITLTWDKQGTMLEAGAVAKAVLTLSVSSTITGIQSFSFDITFEGTG